tara:strand:+ start:725 stop:2824 length:2100 start_codon:yes stop_codon:yes gene_type:complete
MPLVNFANLDFDQIKTSIKDYLRTNSNFTDYDFEGSNLSAIIDVLAYNTYITSYNANMVSNEVFIDSATLRENVISLARNVGYVPKSVKAARANITFSVDVSTFSTKPESITLNKGIAFQTKKFGTENYSFSISDDITATVFDDTATFENIDIYEGTYITNNFTVDAYNPNQRYILQNANVDLSTLRVSVKSNQNASISRKYKQADSLFNIDSESAVYWVQEIEDERYEVVFGDGVFGKKLESPNYIEISYITTNGEGGNGFEQFLFAGKLTNTRLGTTLAQGISSILTNTNSFGGTNIESIESVKKSASRTYASQNRAVTAVDYESVVPIIYPETESISVFGGEELSPPQFGKVYISVKPINGAYLSNFIKDNIKRDLKQYSVAGIVPEIIDLKYLYIEPDIKAYYNTNLAKSQNAVSSVVTGNVERYADSTELNKFGARFKYSKFLKMIDDSDESITSNITTVVMRRDLRVVLNSFAEYEICFGNRFYIKNHGHGTHGGQIGYNIKSSGFSVSGIPGTVYLADSPYNDLDTGTVNLIRLNSATEAVVVKRDVGTVDYIKGEVKLNPINITSTLLNRGFPLIEISAIPYSNDVIGLQDLYLQLDTNNTTISSISDRISSGNDISGSNYIVSSSYANGSLVRGPVITISRGSVDDQSMSTMTTNRNRTRSTGTTTTSTTSTTTTTPTSSPSSPSGGYTY